MPEDPSTAQQQVAAFVGENGMHAPPAYRLLGLAAEVGRVAADAAESSEYGHSPASLSKYETPIENGGDAGSGA